MEGKSENPNLALSTDEVVPHLDMKIGKIEDVVKELLKERLQKEVREKLASAGMLRQLWDLINMNYC